jgi:hypothetical protein
MPRRIKLLNGEYQLIWSFVDQETAVQQGRTKSFVQWSLKSRGGTLLFGRERCQIQDAERKATFTALYAIQELASNLRLVAEDLSEIISPVKN